ncbi:MAG: hypothetical protein K0Q73_9137 [Paenibacillus sp.]|nr:hypothetical protein [Paenibacillus sp.]
MNKATRLIKLIDKLNTGQKYTVSHLAQEFGVSYRTMLRDLQEVEEMGVPLYSENGAHGGYRVLKKTHEVSQKESSVCSIIDLQDFHAIGFDYTMPLPSSGEAQVLIPRLWLKLEQRIHEIAYVVNRKKRTSVIFHSPDEAIVHVCYEVQRPSPVPEGMVGISVPARKYIIYPHRGSMDKANRLRTGERASAWVRRKGIEIDATFSVEWYDDNRFDPYSPTNEFHFLRVIQLPDIPPTKEAVSIW